MPKVLYECPAVTDAVTRPVVLEIMRQVLEWTGLPREMTIQFPGETGRLYQNGSTVTNQTQYNRFGTDSRPRLLRSWHSVPGRRTCSRCLAFACR